MYSYSNLYIGKYFLFLLNASDYNPIKIEFREPEITKEKRTTKTWREKIYLYSTILARKWLDYRFKDKFIPRVKYDNILPLELNYNFLNPVGKPVKIGILSQDKYYRRLIFKLIDKNSKTVFKKEINHLGIGKEHYIDIDLKISGLYKIMVNIDDENYYKSNISFIKEEKFKNLSDIKDNYKDLKIYCSLCNSRVYPMESSITRDFIYKNYIPFKDYFDIDGLGMDYISNYIKKISYPGHYKRGLMHLLNIIRLSSIEDELTIITNLFKDDPPFAYFITERLFLFQMIPLMEDRELQRILNRIDDDLIALSLKGEEDVLISKVLKNISNRRSKIILNDMHYCKEEKRSIDTKNDINRIIKFYFEERYGRVLRIPYKDKIVYTVEDLNSFCKYTIKPEEAIKHSGELVGFLNNNFFLIHNEEKFERCLKYDIESYKDKIFNVTGITESTIYLKVEISFKYAVLHMYNWINSLEDSKVIENVTKNSIIPLLLFSTCLILTIGAIDKSNIPHEQIIRLKTK